MDSESSLEKLKTGSDSLLSKYNTADPDVLEATSDSPVNLKRRLSVVDDVFGEVGGEGHIDYRSVGWIRAGLVLMKCAPCSQPKFSTGDADGSL